MARHDLSYSVRCGNPMCVVTGRGKSFGLPPANPSRFIGIFFPGTRCYVHCYCCGSTNKIAVTEDGVTIEDLGKVEQCPTRFPDAR
jgi:hypothetical protein